MVVRSALLWLSEHQGAFDFVRGNPLTQRMASRFVAGETLDSAIDAVRRLGKTGTRASLDLLGESVTEREEAVRARDEVIDTLDRIAETGVDANVSVKLTQMGLDLDYDWCARNVRELLTHAKQLGIFVRLDMESSHHTERTLRLFQELHGEFGDTTGVVVQSYLRQSADDVAKLIAMGARVRLCKGAYAEPAEIAFQRRHEVSASFVELLEQLLTDGNYPAIATHDDPLIEHALRFVRTRNLSPDQFEFQMLYGVRRDLQGKLRRDGFNVRVYVPFGTHWYPYLMRRLAERPANVAFMAMSLLKEGLLRL
jgi:proline dehydrogenase